MTDDRHLSGYKPPARQPQPGEPLFDFLRGHDRFACELRDCGPYGTEAQFFQNEEFVFSRRLPTRELAISWAEQERAAILDDQRLPFIERD